MGIGISIFLIAVGAILTFALNVTSDGGVDLDLIGIILMAVGALGLLAAVTIFGGKGDSGSTTIIER